MISYCSRKGREQGRCMHGEETDFLPDPFSCDKLLILALIGHFVHFNKLTKYMNDSQVPLFTNWILTFTEVLSCNSQPIRKKHSLKIPLICNIHCNESLISRCKKFDANIYNKSILYSAFMMYL